MKLRFHPDARSEYVDALLYIEERRAGYGRKFEEEVESTLDLARSLPNAGRLLTGFPPEASLRAFLVRRFPYSLIISASADDIIVYAVAHQRRDSGYWHERLST